jgi:uncharacterized 2Fe-2S/4Fe-4S cluster protein (DUF4445 family)
MPLVAIAARDASVEVEVEVGTALLDAIVAAGAEIEASCGGSGTCGQCRVQVTEGSVERVTRGVLTASEIEQGWVLACSSRVTQDVTLRLEDAAAPATPDSAADLGHDLPAGERTEPLAAKRFLEVAEPSKENSFSDLERIERALAGAGEEVRLRCDLSTLQGLASSLRNGGHRVTATLAESGVPGAPELVKLEPGDTTARCFGVAIDVGTTTCAAHLVDLSRDRILATGAEYNRQSARGLDIISRINYARNPERRADLRRLVLETINGLIDEMCREHGIAADEIDNAVVAGNTTMGHLLLGLDPEHIRLDPYTPTANRQPLLRGREIGLHVHPNALVLCAPGVGSYVGGDITAGLIHTALATDVREVSLYLDIGTNGEVVVGNGEWLMACAASAGPAFEGRGVRCGVRAGPGAVERVRIHPGSGRADVSVIGGGRARGLCGSGVIDLLAELWSAGFIDSSGRFDASRSRERIRGSDGSSRNAVYTVIEASESATGDEIVLDEHDIQSLLRTKAAVYAACSFMLKSIGLEFGTVKRVYVAGGFGRFLDLEKSITIGLLPDLPLESFTYLGNSALAGAHAMLRSRAAREKVEELSRRITYLELNVTPAYMDEYTAALFLPHTDSEQFPSVKRRRGAESAKRESDSDARG